MGPLSGFLHLPWKFEVISLVLERGELTAFLFRVLGSKCACSQQQEEKDRRMEENGR